MTLQELQQAIHDLPQRASSTPVYVEDQRGELHELESFEVERFPGDSGEGTLVITFLQAVADV